MFQIYSFRKLSVAFLFAAFVSLMTPSQAIAEYCWVIGCEGKMGWIAINPNQGAQKGTELILVFGPTYQYDPSGNVFQTHGLPDVNSIAITQKHGTPLLKPKEKEELNAITPEGYRLEEDGVIDEKAKTWKDKPFPRNGYDYAFPMADGTKVKILGYDFTDKGHLFALVVVTEDGGS